MSIITETRADAVERIVRRAGYDQYASVARQVGDALPTERPVTGYDVRDAARHAGLYHSVPDHIVSSIVTVLNGSEVAPTPDPFEVDSEQRQIAGKVRALAASKGAPASEVEEVLVNAGLVFDKDHAVGVLSEYAHNKGLTEKQTEQALVEAGLVEPAPEAEVEEDEGSMLRRTVDRLVAFARRHGFEG